MDFIQSLIAIVTTIHGYIVELGGVVAQLRQLDDIEYHRAPN
jgi:hypothetical protein